MPEQQLGTIDSPREVSDLFNKSLELPRSRILAVKIPRQFLPVSTLGDDARHSRPNRNNQNLSPLPIQFRARLDDDIDFFEGDFDRVVDSRGSRVFELHSFFGEGLDLGRGNFEGIEIGDGGGGGTASFDDGPVVVERERRFVGVGVGTEYLGLGSSLDDGGRGDGSL